MQHSPREIRHLDFVSQFTSNIRHAKGAENPVADALSQIELNGLAQHQGIDFEDMAKAQASDSVSAVFIFTTVRGCSHTDVSQNYHLRSSRLEHHDHLSLTHSGDLSSMPFIHFRTLASGPRNA